MSLEILYNQGMQKLVYDKKKQEFVKKKFIALCNSIDCSPTRSYQGKRYKITQKDTLKYAQKDVSPSTSFCPDCGSVLMWKQEDKLKTKHYVNTRRLLLS